MKQNLSKKKEKKKNILIYFGKTQELHFHRELFRFDSFVGAIKLHDGPKYLITERLINSYIWQLNLTIRNIQKNDFGEYTCTSVNALGKQDARIRLQGKFPIISCFFPFILFNRFSHHRTK